MRTRRSRSSGDPVPSAPSAPATGHVSVLLHEAIEHLAVAPDDIVVDATLGGAGHARALADRLGERGILIGFDLDADAIERATHALAGTKPRIELVQDNFRHLAQVLADRHIPHLTKALFDLGWSSYQLDSGRGFSFMADEPLIMTYAKETGALTAGTIVNEWAEGSLADVIYGWGGERYARRIARAIVEARAHAPIEKARQLAEIVRRAVPPPARRGKTHPATKTFQALRIATNDELGALQEGLAAAWHALLPGGRIAVISFHSLEDRAVKTFFAEREHAGEGKRITRKPLSPSEAECASNPRARSAKLRVAEKTAKQTAGDTQYFGTDQ